MKCAVLAIDVNSIATSVLTALLISIGSWIILRFTKWGSRYWASLDAVIGGKTTAILALFATIIAVSAIIVSFFHPASIKVTIKRIGPNGIEKAGFDPGVFTSSTKEFQPITGITESDDSQVCTVNYLQEAGGSCLLHRDDKWRMKVSGAAACRVVCYKFDLAR